MTTSALGGFRLRQAIAFGFACAVATPARAQAVEVVVDGTAPGKPLNPVWSYFGYDEVNNTTSPDSEDLLQAITQMMEAQVRVRTHFLLNSTSGAEGLKWGATNVYSEMADGTPVYDWTVMDQIMDTVTQTGARPYAEIAFMPQALTRSAGPYRNSQFDALDGGLLYPPKADAWPRWGALIRAWAEHTKARYPDAATTWIWELWNEPNIGYWHGTAAEYHQLYDYTEQALHDALPTVPLGGPETAGVGADFLNAFLKHCDSEQNYASGKTGTRLDFISFHAKGGVDISGNHVRMNLGNQLAQHLSGFQVVANSAKFKSAPIVIGEADPDGCAACSAPPANAYRTMAAYGVYELAMMKHSQTLADQAGVTLQGVTTWAWMFKNLPFFANYRQLQSNGIHLPVLNAYKMLGQLRGNALPLTSSGALGAQAIVKSGVRGAPDIDGLAASTDTQLTAIVWNYHDDLTTAPAAQIALRIKVPAAFGASVKVSQLRFDEQNGSSTAKWLELGKPATPTADQIATLKSASELVTLEAAHDVPVAGGEITETFELPRSGASLFIVDAAKPADQAGGGSAGQSSASGAAAGGSAGASAAGAPSGGAASGGVSAGGGAEQAPAGQTDSQATQAPQSASGCGCRLHSEHDARALWLIASLLVLARAQRRRR